MLFRSGANARHHVVFKTVFDTSQGLLINIGSTATFIADDFVPFDTDQRRDVSEFEESASFLIGDELPVGKDLEITVRMSFQNLEQFRMHERLTADDAKECVPLLLRFCYEFVHRGKIDRLLLARDIDPASLAPQIAAVDDRNIQKRREELPFLHASSMPEDRQGTLDAEIPDKLPEQSLVRFEHHPLCHTQRVHFRLTPQTKDPH